MTGVKAIVHSRPLIVNDIDDPDSLLQLTPMQLTGKTKCLFCPPVIIEDPDKYRSIVTF